MTIAIHDNDADNDDGDNMMGMDYECDGYFGYFDEEQMDNNFLQMLDRFRRNAEVIIDSINNNQIPTLRQIQFNLILILDSQLVHVSDQTLNRFMTTLIQFYLDCSTDCVVEI